MTLTGKKEKERIFLTAQREHGVVGLHFGQCCKAQISRAVDLKQLRWYF